MPSGKLFLCVTGLISVVFNIFQVPVSLAFQMLIGRVQHEFKFIIEDTPMAVTKKSLIDNSPSAKTPKTKSEKPSPATPVAPSKMKTTVKHF